MTTPSRTSFLFPRIPITLHVINQQEIDWIRTVLVINSILIKERTLRSVSVRELFRHHAGKLPEFEATKLGNAYWSALNDMSEAGLFDCNATRDDTLHVTFTPTTLFFDWLEQHLVTTL